MASLEALAVGRKIPTRMHRHLNAIAIAYWEKVVKLHKNLAPLEHWQEHHNINVSFTLHVIS